jgi:predicted PurR-regulated permease PerM
MAQPSYSPEMISVPEKWAGLGTALLGLALGVLFLYTLAPFVITLMIGAIIALLCFPLHRALVQRGVPAWLSGVLLTVGVSLLILIPLGFVAVSVAYRLGSLVRQVHLPDLSALADFRHNPMIASWLEKVPPWIPLERQWFNEQGLALAQKTIGKLSELSAAFLGQIPGLLLGTAVVLIATYFFIVDGRRFTRFLQTISPLKPKKSQQLFEAFSTSCRGVVLGMLAAALVQGVLIAIIFALTQTPNALLWGLAGIIMGMVPVIGVAPILIGGIVFHLVAGSWVTAVLVVAGAGLISTSDNVVRSWVLKGHGEMHPLLGLVSAFGAVSVLGPTGIILGPIIAAVFVAFLQMFETGDQ